MLPFLSDLSNKKRLSDPKRLFRATFFPLCLGVVLYFFLVFPLSSESGEPKRIPMIYSSDLFQPPEDPDDHYDLAILSGLGELELKALIFDMATAHRKSDEFGKTALMQMSKITGHPAPPWKIGLRNPLRSPDDKALDQPEEFQGGVALILSTLEHSEEPVAMFLVGSCRDFAAAFNRNPELLRQKVKAVYVNAGNGPDGKQTEWNVTLDPNAYRGLMKSGLPICWCPCFTNVFQLSSPEDVSAGKAFATYFVVPNQAELLASARKEVKNYFFYALNKSQAEPLAFLDREPEPLPTAPRNMWCTGPFLHAAGRKIYKIGDRQWAAWTPEEAKSRGITDSPVEVFRFEPISLEFVENPKNQEQESDNLPELRGNLNDKNSSTRVFRYIDPDFNEIMPSVLADLLRQL